jgi:hypothetical protein
MYQVKAIPSFQKMLKRVIKGKPQLLDTLDAFIQTLEIEPAQGTPLGKGCYKIRVSLPGKGKRGGARLITYVQFVQNTVYLLSIYEKSDMENISEKALDALILEAIEQ